MDDDHEKVMSMEDFKHRRRRAGVAKFRSLPEDAQEALIEAMHAKGGEHLTPMEQAAADADDEDTEAVCIAEWSAMTPEEQDAEIDAYEEWERSERGGETE